MPRPPAGVDPYKWTLNLPPGHHCSVGMSNNMTVAADGEPSPGGRVNEDKFFTCSSHGDRMQVYMVLDGHDGVRACEFAQKHLPSVFLQSEIRDEYSLRTALHRAFYLTEMEFFVRIDPHITRRMTLQLEIDQKAHNSAEALRLYPGQVQEIQSLDDDIRGGTTAVISVVFNSKLYVANCGDSRAVLCYEDMNGKLVAEQISVDHNTENEGELARLAEVGLDPHTLLRYKRLGTQQNTRSIGDYSIKGGYKDIDTIAHAKQEPGTAEPFISSPFDLTNFRGFLILMTDGLYEAYEAWTHRPAMVNQDLAHLVSKEIRTSTEFHLVAQNVVENVKTKFQQSCKKGKQAGRLDDITLIVRNFGYPNLSHSSSHPSMPSTAPVVSSQESVFFPAAGRQVPYYPSQSVSTQQHDYTASLPPHGLNSVPQGSLPPHGLNSVPQGSLPPHGLNSVPQGSLPPHGLNSVPQGHDSRQQQAYRSDNNPRQYTGINGSMSVGEGAFIPEPESGSDFPPQQTNAQPGYGQANWGGARYYSQGPLSNVQQVTPLPYTNDQPHHQHATLTAVASYPDITHTPPRGRQISVPTIHTVPRRPAGQAIPEYRRSADYENTNPLGTEQIQSEQSTSRSLLYENVTLRTQDLSSTDPKRHSDNTLEQQTQAMSLQDPTPQKQTLPATPNKLPVVERTPAILEIATIPVAMANTPPSAETTPKLKRHDSDFELYGWRMETPPVSLNETSSTLTEDKKQEYDTLQDKLVMEATASPKMASTLESTPVTSTPKPRANDDANLTPTEAMPPVAQSILEVKDIEEDRETFVMDLSDELQEPSDHEGREDVDGQIKAYVKFADSFPDIGWDEIEA